MIRSIGEFRVNFPLSNISNDEISLRHLTVLQTAREHDQVIIRVRSRRVRWGRSLASGTPLRVFWRGVHTEENTFVGYVTHVRPIVKSANNKYEFDIIAIAASRDLRNTGKNTWNNKSIPEIVQDVGRKFGFKVVTKPHPYRRPQTVQHGETYWELLYRLAQRIGYTLRVDQTTIYFLPLEDLVGAAVSRAPRLSASPAENIEDGGIDAPSIFSFSAWGGASNESAEYSTDTSVVVAVDPTSGAVYEESADPGSAVKRRRTAKPKYQRYEAVIAHNRKDAKSLAQGKASNGMLAIDAKVECVGSGDLCPYRPVYLVLPEDELTGWWVIKSAAHHIDMSDGQYVCEMTVSTDGFGSSSLPPRQARKKRDIAYELKSGWALQPATSKVSTPRPGFVVGKTADGQNASRWVAV